VAIGAYQLDAGNSSNRVGRVYLLVLKPNGDRESGEHEYVTSVLEEVSTSGVLDLKWEPLEENLLGVATSSSITIFRLDFENGLPILEKHKEVILEDNIMALYIEWIRPNRVLIGDSGGSVQIYGLTDSDSLVCMESKKFHEYLVWVIHYDSRTDTIYSGADDGKFFAFYSKDINTSAKHVVKKFDVGVTSITTYKDYLAVGCYDDNLRVYSQVAGEMKPTLTMKTVINLGGAVWRTIWIPEKVFLPGNSSEEQDEYLIIGAACARNGIHIVRINTTDWSSGVVLSCNEHLGPLAYGFDIRVNQDDKSFTIASCYFDSHLFHVWDVKKETIGVL